MVTKYVKVNGQSYPIKMSQAAIMQMAIDEGLSTDQIPAISNIMAWPVKRICLLLLHSIKVECRRANLPCDLTIDHIIDAVAEDGEFQHDIQKLAADSMPAQKEPKKKIIQAPGKSPQ